MKIIPDKSPATRRITIEVSAQEAADIAYALGHICGCDEIDELECELDSLFSEITSPSISVENAKAGDTHLSFEKEEEK